jgi:hypothetical protein
VFRRMRVAKAVAIVGLTAAYMASPITVSATSITPWVFVGGFQYPGQISGVDICLKAGILSPGTTYFGSNPTPSSPHNYAAIKIMKPTQAGDCSEPALSLPAGKFKVRIKEYRDDTVCNSPYTTTANPIAESYFFIEAWACGNPSGWQSFHTEVQGLIACTATTFCSTNWISSASQAF